MTLRLIAVLLAVLGTPALVSAESTLTHVDVFGSGQDGYFLYRIPAIKCCRNWSVATNTKTHQETKT